MNVWFMHEITGLFWNVNPGLFWILEGLRFPDMA